jgi:hypothetical protein
MKELRLQEKSSFASKVIRALGKASGVRSSLPSPEKKPAGVSVYRLPNGVHREFTSALLEAEEARAEGLMGYQRRNLPH